MVSTVENNPDSTKLEELIIRDRKLLFTIVSYIMVLVVYTNHTINLSPLIGTAAMIVYFLINATFLGQFFFREEARFLRFTLGSLILIVFLGLVAEAVMVIYNLDIVRTAVVLGIMTALCSLSNKWMKRKNVR